MTVQSGAPVTLNHKKAVEWVEAHSTAFRSSPDEWDPKNKAELVNSLVALLDAQEAAIKKQLRHDLKSPAIALNLIRGDLHALPSDTRELIEAAIERLGKLLSGLS